MAVTRIARVSFTSADADALAAFYIEAFGFERIGTEERKGQGFAQLMGIDGAEARAVVLRLGHQAVELLAFAVPGRPYPPDIAGNDPRFQHIAIVVSDMEAAYARLLACRGWTPITRPAPQHLPASSGGVAAFKFRDPEGHPLELLAFPPGKVPPAWQGRHESGPCLGIDHSAITVASTAASVDFYERLLGFSIAGGSLNHGHEQERLDGVPKAVVEVTALAPPAPEPPHLELLCYRSGQPGDAAALSSNDIAATRLAIETAHLPALIQNLAAAKIRFISTGLEEEPGAALIRDPDGHALLLRESQDSRWSRRSGGA